MLTYIASTVPHTIPTLIAYFIIFNYQYKQLGEVVSCLLEFKIKINIQRKKMDLKKDVKKEKEALERKKKELRN